MKSTSEHPALLKAVAESTAAYATPYTPGAKHELRRIMRTARILNRKLMPWQLQVARVASERLPSDPSQYHYNVIVVTVPRQSGKTTLMRTVLAQRALYNKRRKAFYTAQTGKDAKARWLDLVNDIEMSALAPYVKKRVAAGSESLTVTETASSISPFAPTADSLHGYTPEDVMLDECFSFTEVQGANILGAIAPAQITIKDKQLWIVSTAGTAQSVFLKKWVEQGQESLNDPNTRIAYFEWSMPEGLDPYDPTSWRFHPALGHTITADALAADANILSAGEWLRAYMNRWTRSAEGIVDIDKWNALINPTPVAPDDFSKVSVAYEVGLNRQSAAVYACWNDPLNSKPMLMLLEAREGAEWLAPFIVDLYENKKPRVIGADDGGETRVITDQLKLMHTKRNGPNGVPVTTLNGKEFSTATAAYIAHIDDGTFLHDGDGGHLASVMNASTRPMGDGKVFSRKDSVGPIPELVAATVALRLHEQAPAMAPKPKFYGG